MAEAVAVPGGFGLYVHWPFCQAKCPYCDFNSHVVGDVDQARWAAALAGEVTRLGRETAGRRLESVFFGGGTPSLMAPDTVAAVLEAAQGAWAVAPDCEVTLEANPTSVEAERFAGYRAAGVTRVSLGVQALNDGDLRRLGRRHDVADARAAVAVARAAFDRVSFDLIYARQDQTLAAWQAELAEALAMGMDHLSLYQLTVEPGTAFAARHAAGGLAGLPDEDLAADLYEATVEGCAAAGLHLYEVSNFARPGAECRHNLIYWSGGDYVGVGPGAHGRLTLDGRRQATEQISAPGAWLAAVETGGGGQEHRHTLAPGDVAAEYLMMGLRRTQGVSRRRLERMAPLPELDRKIAGLEGLVVAEGDRLRTTDRGRMLLDAVLRDLLAG